MEGMTGTVVLRSINGALKIRINHNGQKGTVRLSPYEASVFAPFAQTGDTGRFVTVITPYGPQPRFRVDADVIDYAFKPFPSKALVRLDECVTLSSLLSLD